MKPRIANEIIRASAGTGKTTELSLRLVRLLALGVAPERIVALTFTRAAAGEIFDRLVGRLAVAATDAALAAGESARLGIGRHLSVEDFRRLLRRVILAQHLCQIGTIDGFMVRIVRAFPLEFGLDNPFAILGEHEERLEKDHVLRDILGTHMESDEQSQDFFNAFKDSTYGEETKKLGELVQQYVDDLHPLYLANQDAGIWGNRERIWPAGCRWPLASASRPEALVRLAAALRSRLAGLDLNDKQLARWDGFLQMLGSFGGVITKEGEELFKKLAAADPELAACGQAELVLDRRKLLLDGRLAELCREAIAALAGIVLNARLESTCGLYRLLSLYETDYQSKVRRQGRLTFADIPFLICGGTDTLRQLNIEYRLDGAYDHWALDEFQDTSRTQWQVLKNLADEVFQDGSGQRSFFIVGDVKQAIYGWRGGDSRLFAELAEFYRGNLEQRSLSKSYRYGPEITGMVNQVFGRLAAEADLPEKVRRRWQEIWEEHETEQPAGHACLLETPRSEKDSAPWMLACQTVLEQTRPWERGLTSAVLVRGNRQGQDICDFLRSQGLTNVIWEGDKGINDNPAVAAMLELFRFAEHPGDTFAWQHLLMTPFRAIFEHDFGSFEAARSKLPELLRQQAGEQGIAGVIEIWNQKLAAVCELDRFSQQRLGKLVTAACRFAESRTPGSNLLDFVDYVNSYTVLDTQDPAKVRVMTIHHSKGLGFDLVILPLPDSGGGLATLRPGQMLKKQAPPPEGGAAWLLQQPKKEFVTLDQELSDAWSDAVDDSCIENLCVLYVAMTRAKKAVYAVIEKEPKSTATLRPSTLLRRGLVEEGAEPVGSLADGVEILWQSGDPGWFEAEQSQPAVSEEEAVRPRGNGPPAASHRRLLPSKSAEEQRNAGDLFASRHHRQALEFGTDLHALFEQLEWADRDDSLDTAIQRWRQQIGAPNPKVEEAFLKTIANPEIRQILQLPGFGPGGGASTLWREQNFEIILDGQWVSGTFDRVVVEHDARGTPRAALILDYKSNHVPNDRRLAELTDHYRPQMHLYRRVLARLVGLSPEAISGALIFTQPAKIVRL